MTLNARFNLKCALRTACLTYVCCGFSDSTVRIGVAGGGGGVDWRAQPPPCGQLTRCFSAVAELLVSLCGLIMSGEHECCMVVNVLGRGSVQLQWSTTASIIDLDIIHKWHRCHHSYTTCTPPKFCDSRNLLVGLILAACCILCCHVMPSFNTNL